jgi:hypothetical protein
MFAPRLLFTSAFLLSSTALQAAEKEPDYFRTPFQSPELTPSQMNLGGVGLIQMPSGRMANEGAFSFGYTHNDEYDFYTLSIQLLPWLESTLRYTQVSDLLYSDDASFSGDTKLADKGIDAKIRLLQESRWLPDVSVGLRDLGGTGLFDGEFIAATKRLTTRDYGQFDFTLGLGWGYFGERGNVSNPLCSAAERFCNRIDGYSDNGGSIDYNRWFTGNASLFGGIEYQTPYEPLTLKLEYDGNDYSQDYPTIRGGVDMTPRTPWNIGAVYSLGEVSSLRLSYERGTTVTLGFSLSTNFSDTKVVSKSTAVPALNNTVPTTLDAVDWKKVDSDLANVAGYQNVQIYQDKQKNNLTIFADQTHYRDRNLAHERAAAVIANNVPDNIQSYEIIESNKRLPLTQTHIVSSDYRDVANVSYIGASIEDATQKTRIDDDIFNHKPLYDGYEKLSYGLSPHLKQSIGNPENFYLFNVGVNGNASYWFNNNLELTSSIYINLLDNYDSFTYTVPSDGTSNYRVRTLIRRYVTDNDAYLNNLQLTWFQKYGSNWYQQVYGGYLETMFAGVGSEVLYRQPNSNWAIGLDVNAISQRDPSSWFDTFDSPHDVSPDSKVLNQGSTGHLSLYYEPTWKMLDNTLLKLDFGKFLAQDVGVRIDFSKQFKTGIVVGAFASKTDMSAEEYGEGSFTKGFYLSIPYDLMSVKPTTSRAHFNWQPLTRDGGQMLSKKNHLFNITDPVSPWYQRPVQNR